MYQIGERYGNQGAKPWRAGVDRHLSGVARHVTPNISVT
jgi:hypothetical protein